MSEQSPKIWDVKSGGSAKLTKTATPVGLTRQLASEPYAQTLSQADLIQINAPVTGTESPPTHREGNIIHHSVNQQLEATETFTQINSGKLWVVNSRRRNGLIIFKGFHAEFAGPGAAVGGVFDQGCRRVIPLGNLSLVAPESHEEQQKALKIRLQWIRLTQNFTDQAVPAQRARMILEQFKSYFDNRIIERVPDEAFALLVGVLPGTIRKARLTD
ncbi:MAG: hypothetical protein AAFW84_10215 [Cyanobacteria bacterium J06635_15]